MSCCVGTAGGLILMYLVCARQVRFRSRSGPRAAAKSPVPGAPWDRQADGRGARYSRSSADTPSVRSNVPSKLGNIMRMILDVRYATVRLFPSVLRPRVYKHHAHGGQTPDRIMQNVVHIFPLFPVYKHSNIVITSSKPDLNPRSSVAMTLISLSHDPTHTS